MRDKRSPKKEILKSQLKAATKVNKELISLYWKFGEIIVIKQEKSAWGSIVIEKLAKDFQNEFPGIGGVSRANVFIMKAFFSAYIKVAQTVRQFESLPINEHHVIIILNNLKKIYPIRWSTQL